MELIYSGPFDSLTLPRGLVIVRDQPTEVPNEIAEALIAERPAEFQAVEEE